MWYRLVIEHQPRQLAVAQFTDLVARIKKCGRWSALIDKLTCSTIVLLLLGGVAFRSWWVLSGVGICILLGLFSDRVLKRQVRGFERHIEELMRFLRITDDPRLIGDILDLQVEAQRHIRTFEEVYVSCEHATMRLLPLLRETDAEALNTRQRELLRANLFTTFTYSGGEHGGGVAMCQGEFSELILKALEHIGDRRDLPDVQRLIHHRLLHRTEVRELAHLCANAIIAREAQGSNANMSLRPGDKSDEPNSLLRSASDATTTDQSVLLRPTSSSTEE